MGWDNKVFSCLNTRNNTTHARTHARTHDHLLLRSNTPQPTTAQHRCKGMLAQHYHTQHYVINDTTCATLHHSMHRETYHKPQIYLDLVLSHAIYVDYALHMNSFFASTAEDGMTTVIMPMSSPPNVLLLVVPVLLLLSGLSLLSR